MSEGRLRTKGRSVVKGRKKPRTQSLRRTRDEKNEETRAALVSAAAEVVGKFGYERASVARITKLARVAHGTFYNYFSSRQDLFDQLLPLLGKQVLNYMRINMPRNVTGLEREECRIRLYFTYLRQHPWFHRIVNEAEVMAPKAHKEYFETLTRGYVQALRRHSARGEITGYNDGQLEAVVYMLLAARIYLPQRFILKNGTMPEHVLKTYVQFLRHGLLSFVQRPEPKRSPRLKAAGLLVGAER